MKAVTATVVLVALGAVALAKPIPVERPSLALAHSDISIARRASLFSSVAAIGQR